MGGLSGQERLYAYTLNGVSLKQRTVYLLGERYLFGLTLAAPAVEMATFDPTFTAFLGSFSDTPSAAGEPSGQRVNAAASTR